MRLEVVYLASTCRTLQLLGRGLQTMTWNCLRCLQWALPEEPQDWPDFKGVRYAWVGNVICEALRRVDGNLEHVRIPLLIVHHFVCKSGKELMLESLFGETQQGCSYFLTGKLMGASKRGSLWSADNLLKTICRIAGLSSGSSGKLAADCGWFCLFWTELPYGKSSLAGMSFWSFCLSPILQR